MALQSSTVYHLMQKVFKMYEDGEIVGQTKHTMTGSGLQKALSGKFCAKLYHFKMFQGLKVYQSYAV